MYKNTSKINLLSVDLLVLTMIIFSHLFYVIKILAIGRQVIYIPWPGRQIITNIHSYRDNINNDLVGLSYSQSPYEILTVILANILPNDQSTFLAVYSVLSSILLISIFFLAYKLTVFVIEMLVNYNNLNNEFRKNIRIAAGAILVIRYFTTIISGRAFWYNKIIPPLDHLLIPYIAGWDFPTHFHMNPSGVSMLIIFTSLLIVLRQRKQWLNFKIPQVKINWIIMLFLIPIATFIHPIVPLIEIFLLFILFIITKSYSNQNLTLIAIIALLWLTSCAFINYLYPQEFVDSDTFIDIYVGRHEAHYLPSFYLAKWSTLHTTITILTLTILVSNTRMFFSKNLTKLALAGIALFLLINGIQFITVELANSKPFTKLSLTRVLSTFGFIYFVILTYIIAILLSVKISVKSLKRKFFTNLFLIRKKLLHIISVSIEIANNKVTKLILIVFVSTLLIAHYSIIFKRIETRPEIAIAKYIEAQNFNETPHAIIDISDGSDYWEWRLLIREVGQLPVFHDYYFPFSEAGALTWHHRKKITEKFLKCIGIKNNLAQCAKFNTPIILLSRKHYPEDKEILKINYKIFANLMFRVYILLPNESEKTNNTKSS